MKDNRAYILLAIIITLTVAIAGVGGASTAKISLDPSKVEDIDPGGTFNTDIIITDVNNLYAWQVRLNFDADVVQVDNVTEGPFLGSTGNETFFSPPNINNDKGYMIIGGTFMVPFPEEGVTGNGVLATIVFSVTGQGTITLEFDDAHDAHGDALFTYLREVQWIGGEGEKVPLSRDLENGTFSNGGQPVLSLPLIIAVVVIVALCGIGAFYYMRRRRT